MASPSTQAAPSTSFSSSSSSIHRPKYEVFLSFRGADTRYGFTDHLYAALKKIGIIVFRDDEELERGKELHPGLKDAIEESQYAVVVVSEKFAESKSCLFELDVIMKCRQMGRLTVFPVFYLVDPSHVRNQTGDFGECFAKVKDELAVSTTEWENWKAILTEIGDYSVDPLESCKGALKNVGNLTGWHVKDRSESKIIEEISLKIFGQLIRNSTCMDESLVGIESSAEEIMKLLDLELGGVRYIGICGMGGIGKTTLAKVIFQMAFPKFEAHCFISQLGESKNDRIIAIQKQIISSILSIEVANSFSTDYEVSIALQTRLSSKKVLIVLDDALHCEQVKQLAGSSKWFGEGSRIIITSRNRHFPHYLCKDNIYEVKGLNYSAALQLFCLKAFNDSRPKEEFEGLTTHIVSFANGLPLALEVFGSYLYGAEKCIWESHLIKLKENLDANIIKSLQITFDGLEGLVQEMFLDIVCFFNPRKVKYLWIEYSRDGLTSELKDLGYPSETLLQALERKSLIKFTENKKLFVHDLLRQMGQEIARYSRLWRMKDIISALNEKTKIDEVESLLLKDFHVRMKSHTKLSFEAFLEIKGLRLRNRLWRMKDIISALNEKTNEVESLLLEDFFVPKEPCTELSFEAFSKMKKLRILKISSRRKWYGEPSKLKLSNKLHVLEWIDYPLESLPAESSFKPTNLVKLILCTSKIKQLWHGQKCFSNLKHISLSGSRDLIEMPDLSKVPKLEILDLSYCTSLSTVHSSIGLLKLLRQLSLMACCNLKRLPDKIISESIEYLNLGDCFKLQNFPNMMGKMSFLRHLNIAKVTMKELPSSFATLPPVKEFLANEAHIGELPFKVVFSRGQHDLTIVFYGSNSNFSLSSLVSALNSLKTLILHGWILSQGANSMDLSGLSECSGCNEFKEFLEALLSNSRSLWKMRLSNSNLGAISQFASCWSISKLDLSKNKLMELPDSILTLSNLKELVLNDCTSLRALPKLPLSLVDLKLRNCPLLDAFGSLMTPQISEEMLWTYGYSSMVAYIALDYEPHKILYLHPQSPLYKGGKEDIIKFWVACGPTEGLGIPEWFTHRSSSSNKKIQIHMDWKSGGGMCAVWACALLIVYEVRGQDQRNSRKWKFNEPENLNIGVCEGSNPDIAGREVNNSILPEFICKFQANESSPVQPCVFCLPKVGRVGSHGVWAFINIPLSLQELRWMERRTYLVSITASSDNVELKECGMRLLDMSAYTELPHFLSSISRPALDLKSLSFPDPFFKVTGPIKLIN